MSYIFNVAETGENYAIFAKDEVSARAAVTDYLREFVYGSTMKITLALVVTAIQL